MGNSYNLNSPRYRTYPLYIRNLKKNKKILNTIDIHYPISKIIYFKLDIYMFAIPKFSYRPFPYILKNIKGI